MVFGVYPTITLADARSKRDDAKKLLVNGVDPSAFKQESKQAHIEEVKNTLQQIALEWHSMKVKKWSAGYASDILEAFNKDVLPFIGQRPAADIKPLELLNVLKRWKTEARPKKPRKFVNAAAKCFVMPS
ncbi:integrase arm-type DNA-binding domain-containing protein [Salmonella enterica]|nr:integrase arm-type DNA-binding domain-containing protein [Salmonella enterica subsp. enterica]EHM1916024.1 integrase arm-type DNA-binding domain-containing protein [Salmonella enterica subsp. enterica]EIF7528964.1 integrase arm-type DNA-binding domain-containing protein [Salmonella enterica]